MKRMFAFILILFFALLLIVGYAPGIYNSRYGKTINIAAQTGLGAGIILFFLLPGKKKTPFKRSDRLDN